MTQTPQRRPLLPLIPTTRHGSRSYMTCHYRCANACDKPIPNTSDNGHISDEISLALHRRGLLQGGAITGGALLVGSLQSSPAAAAPLPAEPSGAATSPKVSRAAFTPVRPNVRDALVTAPGFTSSVIIRWGDPVTADAPDFDVRKQTPQAQRKQFGYNNDYVGVVPLPHTRGTKALLCVNHEYTDEVLMYPTDLYDEATQKKISMAAHGFSVVTIKKGRAAGNWQRVTSKRARHNRRFHTGTGFALVGPAAGDKRLKTSADPTGTLVKGTIGNCSGGTTPWGTVLSGEENFNGYFDASGDLDPRYAAENKRYGLSGDGRGWADVDERFDLTAEPHEPHRFGYIVEIDPLEPNSRPVKHTMLGRFKHEGANVAVAKDGRVVAYLGDDERGDYIYKFVSSGKLDRSGSPAARRRNKKLLTAGTLYVAKFTGNGQDDGKYDGTGRWIPLTSDKKSFVAGMSVADVLIFTRLAADKVGPTKMDRPEDIEPNPVNGKVYCALTNNSNRGKDYPTDEANPLSSSHVREKLGAPLTKTSGNRNGYILEISPQRKDHTCDRFSWDLFLVCGDPAAQETYFGGFDKSRVSPISCPDNVAFDSMGNLWISTDGNVLGSNDGIFRVPVAGPRRGEVRQFLTVPVGAEACGPLISPDDRSVFVAVQHPGENDGATFEKPDSTWPHSDDFPRPSVAVAYRKP